MAADWRLRRAGVGDVAALSLVAGATFLETFAGVLAGSDIVAHCAEKSSPAAFLHWLTDGAGIVTIAEYAAGSAPAGYSVLTPPDLPIETTPADVELKRIYALSRSHGTGLGAALMAEAVDEAQQSGFGRMLLGVYGGNRRARCFYEKQGFVVAGTRKFKVGLTHHDDLIYAKAI